MSEVFRFENAKGYGPFNAYGLDEDADEQPALWFALLQFSNDAAERAIENGIPSGEDGIMNRVTPEYHFGVPDRETFDKWFPPETIEQGKDLGFRICKYEVPDYAIMQSDSGTQVAFDRFDSVEEIS